MIRVYTVILLSIYNIISMSDINSYLFNIFNIKNKYNEYLLANRDKTIINPFEYKFLFNNKYFNITNPFDIVESNLSDDKSTDDNKISIIIYEKDLDKKLEDYVKDNPDLKKEDYKNFHIVVKSSVNLSKIADNNYINEISKQ